MRMSRVFTAVVLAVGCLLGLAAPAQAALGPWVQVSGGGFHTCAINSTKSLYCWGRNVEGQVGKGTTSGSETTPVRIGAAGVWASVTTGEHHTCGITTARNLYCWGRNDAGQTGTGTATEAQLALFRVGAAGVWSSVDAGALHTCGITTARNLYCWGYNDNGQIGSGTGTGNQLSLFRVGAAGVWVSVDLGFFFTCGITTAKNLYCWGQNNMGQIGRELGVAEQASPFRLGAAGVWASVAAGNQHTCGTTTAKNLYCWGSNQAGQLGTGSTGEPQFSLTRVGGAGVWAGIGVGGFHTCGITTAKNLYCWGYNDNGQIGNGSAGSNQLSMFRVGGAGVWATLDLGRLHSCAITTARNVYCWGDDSEGQMGDGTSGANQLTLYRVL